MATIIPDEDIDTGLTGTVVDTQSFSWILLDWILNKLVADPFFENFVLMRISRALQVDAWNHVPFLGVYIVDEKMTPISMAPIQFMHDVSLGFQIILRNNNSAQLLQDLDRASWYIMRLLLRDDELTNTFQTDTGVSFENIKSGRIRERWGITGSENETPLGERQLDFVFQFSSVWAPYGFPDLERITVKTAFPIGGTPEEQEKIQQVKIVYEFNPDSVPTPLPPDP